MSLFKKLNFESAGSDIRASLVVFLIAIPLSLGISLASGAPPSSGLISAALGGLLGAFIGGSYVTINGPAAGLIVVVLSAIQELGHGDALLGFKRMLACVVVVGLIQIISGIIKAGRFAALFPTSVVHGMLSAIGLIIMIKQIHVFFGHKAQGSIFQSVAQIPETIVNLQPESALIGLASIIVLLTYPHLKLKLARFIPAPLVVVGLAIFTSRFLTDVSLVTIPTKVSDFFITPTFDVIFSRESLVAIFSIFFVASLESILSASAVDKLDPLKRESDFNKELWSKGIVNLICGLIGGLPIIAEIVRSSASISQGARSPLANFCHGFFILIFMVIFPSVLNMIPLSALAAILVLVGYRLAQPKQLIEMNELGINAFFSFITTIIVTLGEDLLVGIFAGVLVKLLISYFQGARLNNFFNPDFEVTFQGDRAILNFQGSLIFFSALKQKRIFDKVSHYKNVEINLSQITYMDPTSMSTISKESLRIERNGGVVEIRVPSKFRKVFNYINNHT